MLRFVPYGSRMIKRRRTGAGPVQGYSVVPVRPHVVVLSGAAVPLTAVIPSRVSGRGPGDMGQVRARTGRSGGVNQVGAPPPGDAWRGRHKVTSHLAATSVH
jgi:hypothetical protein